MAGKAKEPGAGDLLPRGSLPCVWMAAGLVAYRLCDRDFRCDESCPFDAAMHGRPFSKQEGEVTALPPSLLEYPEDRRYLPGHTWAGELPSGRIRVGVDGFAARLLRRLTAVILPATGTPVSRGRAACWIEDESATVSLRSPVSGTVLRGNRRLLAYPGLAAEDPYGRGWLLEVSSGPGEAVLDGLMEGDEARERTRADLRHLREVATQALSRSAPSVGPTLADGGEPLADLRRVLGLDGYYALVKGFLK